MTPVASGNRGGRWAALVCAGLGVLVLAGLASPLADFIAETRLIGRLKTSSGDERDLIIMKLLNRGSIRAIPTLFEIPANDAAEVMCRSRGPAAVPAILRVLDQGEDSAKRRSLDTLAELGPDAASAIPRLVPVLEDVRPEVRAYAADVLCELGADPGLILPAIRRGLADPDREVRRVSAGTMAALEEQGLPVLPELIECLKINYSEDPWGYINLEVLASLGRPACAPVMALLGDPRGTFAPPPLTSWA